VACQGVTHVLHARVSSLGGLFLQTMQMPAPSHGSSILLKATAAYLTDFFCFRFLF
jgi:hypothetical protein